MFGENAIQDPAACVGNLCNERGICRSRENGFICECFTGYCGSACHIGMFTTLTWHFVVTFDLYKI